MKLQVFIAPDVEICLARDEDGGGGELSPEHGVASTN